MPVRRDPRTGRWFFRTIVKLPDGARERVSGTPGVPGPYHDLAPSKVGAQEAERRAIARVMNGEPVREAVPVPQAKEVPTIKEYAVTFLENYAASHKPSAQLSKKHILNRHLIPFLGDLKLDEVRQEDVDRLVAKLLREKLSRKLAREITVSWSLDRSNALTETKGWERRVVPISDRLWAALRVLDRSKRHVISRLEGTDLALRYDGTREAILAVYERAGVALPSMPWHSLRHTFCTELACRGVPINVIKELAGHKSIETTLRYMHTDRAAKREAINALRGSHVAAESAKSD